MMKSGTLIFESNYKKLGIHAFDETDLSSANAETLRPYIKVLLVPKGYRLSLDFHHYQTDQYTLFFINSNQYLHVTAGSAEKASMIYYNRDFYCIQIHDAELACDGLLFNNIFEIPKVALSQAGVQNALNIFATIQDELLSNDYSSEEMIRIHLKQLIIHATRAWRMQNLEGRSQPTPAEEDLFRNFSRLVEIHFRSKHSVSEYADLLGIAPKSLSTRLNKLKLENPNEVIKNRIVLEAKRLMMYTDNSIKEIGYQLGYDDPAYFNRIFNQKAGCTPAAFRKSLKQDQVFEQSPILQAEQLLA
jgi:AraC-like DNA-binding protein